MAKVPYREELKHARQIMRGLEQEYEKMPLDVVIAKLDEYGIGIGKQDDEYTIFEHNRTALAVRHALAERIMIELMMSEEGWDEYGGAA